jgi:hypothetical protein
MPFCAKIKILGDILKEISYFPWPNWSNLALILKSGFAIVSNILEIYVATNIVKLRTKNIKRFNLNIWALGGWASLYEIDASLAFLLSKKNFKPQAFICEGTVKACVQRTVSENIPVSDWSKKCSSCFVETKKVFQRKGIKIKSTKNYLNSNDINEVSELLSNLDFSNLYNLNYRGVRVYEIALSSTIRFFQGKYENLTQILDSEFAREILKEYTYSTLINIIISEKIVDENRCITLTSHGYYSDFSPIVHVSKIHNVPSFIWNGSEKVGHVYISNPDSNFGSRDRNIHPDIWNRIKNEELSESQLKVLDLFYESRYGKKLIDKELNTVDNKKYLFSQIGVNFDPTKPLVTLFGHLNWDAFFETSETQFESHKDWIIQSIKRMSLDSSSNYLIRVHPIEKNYGYFNLTADLIKATFPTLPRNIKVIGPDVKLSPADIFLATDFGLTIGGSIGLELSSMGTPVLTSSTSHYTNHGFTIDKLEPEDYLNMILQYPVGKSLNLLQKKLALRYAYHFYIEKPILIPWINEKNLLDNDFYVSLYKILKLKKSTNILSDILDKLLHSNIR